ncbi:hypothetical protein [Latilactobacillus graminis]|uniref:Uncharacterized protein n=2 Tax=Latilactobacillus graminis TaxID=60519 RepID=A0AA89I0U3_9LACO|nr:hypothetical protein [Latilactobacillus graminis]KRM22395.1 hypothetical protein FC90_GL000997 [Latilactobacillus graminis DSM 20719]QFP79432.1 hypothetical protein LG542_03965 [Latilactobacillus graminis]
MKNLKLNDLGLQIRIDKRIIQISGSKNKTLVFKNQLIAQYWFFNLHVLDKIANRCAIQMTSGSQQRTDWFEQ